MDNISRKKFGKKFRFGVSTAAYQIEGAHLDDGKGTSIWDKFTQDKSKIKDGQHGRVACDFYNRYPEDLALMKALNIDNFRFSIAWSRIIPAGKGTVNPKGIDFYDRLIDHCLELGIKPWVTLYHWDLPYELEKRGGWTTRDILDWFIDYVATVVEKYGDRIRHWMVLNEPMVFTGAGYFLGLHAPGKRGLSNFLPAMHHATLAQSIGGRVIKEFYPKAKVGTTYSCSYVTPKGNSSGDLKATSRMDALFNRLFVEPAMGLGYPTKDLPFLKKAEKYFGQNDEQLMPFKFDFIGIQNYTREVIQHAWYVPFVKARIIKASKRDVPFTEMDWEVHPPAIYEMLKQFQAYDPKLKIYVTENGAAFRDNVENGCVHDPERTAYLQQNIAQVLRAKKEGINVKGYFIWTFTDNFEWAEGYHPRFGIVHMDFETQKRTVKDSGLWLKRFLEQEL